MNPTFEIVVFNVYWGKKRESEREIMDAVLAREKRSNWDANFANGA